MENSSSPEPGHGLRLLKNTIALAAPNFLNPLISFILVLLISRYLGKEGLGKYSLVMAYTGMFATMATLGLDALIVREVARRPEDTQVLFFNVSVFGAISAIISILAMNLVVGLLGYGEEILLAALLGSLTLLFTTAIYYMNAVFVSFYKAKFTAFSYLIDNSIRVLVGAGLVLLGYGVVALFFVAFWAKAIGFLVMVIFYVTTIGKPKWKFRADIWKTLIIEAPVFSSIVIFSTIHLSIDQIMLSKLAGVESVGIYSAADKLLAICKTLPIAFAMALLPSLTRKFDQGLEEMRDLTNRSIRYVSIVGIPVILGTVILADRFILLLYGEEFLKSIGILRVHIVSLAPFAALFVLARVLTATDNQKVDMYINAFCAALNFVLNYLLIPIWSEMGAVVATLVTVLAFNQLQYGYIKKKLFKVDFLNPLKRIGPSAIMMGICCYLMAPLNLFANILISALIYLFFLYILGELQEDEKRIFKRALRLGKSDEQ